MSSVIHVSPTFVVNSLAPSEEFYRLYFLAKVAMKSEWYLLLRFGETPIELAFMTARHPFQNTFIKGSANLNLQVHDVDGEYHRLLALGATLRELPSDKPYGLRSFSLFDPCGLCVYIFQPI